MERQNGQAERLVPLTWTGQAKINQLIEWDSCAFAIFLVVFSDKPNVESFISRRYRRVCSENRIPGNFFAGISELHPGFDEVAEALETQECAMPFVHMPTGRFNAECLECANAAHANDDFLANAHLATSDVELT